MANNNKKDEAVQQPQVEEQKQPVYKYFHLDEFLSVREEKLSQGIVNGFRNFLTKKGELYKLSLDAFEEDLKAFLGRFNKKN